MPADKKKKKRAALSSSEDSDSDAAPPPEKATKAMSSSDDDSDEAMSTKSADKTATKDSDSDESGDAGAAAKKSSSDDSDNSDAESVGKRSVRSIGTNDAISESSSELSASDPDKFPDNLDKDCLGDAEDRKNINDMTEVVREQEMYRRMEKREAMINHRRIERNLKRKRKEERRERREKQIDKERRRKTKSGGAASDSSSSDDSSSEEEKKKSSSDSSASEKDSDTELNVVKKGKKKKVHMSSSESEKAESSSEEEATSSDAEDSDYGATTAERAKKEKMRTLKRLQKERKQKARKDKEKKRREAGKKKHLEVEDVFSTSESDDEPAAKTKRVFSSNEEGELSSDEGNREPDMDRPIENAAELNFGKLSRFRCEQWCHHPWFPKTVVGTYVRIGLGLNRNTNTETFRCCEVVGILKTGQPYAFGKQRTNIALQVKLGENKRGFRLVYLSNQPFSENEFTYWRDYNSKHGIPLPTLAQVKNIEKSLQDKKDVELAPKEFEKMIETKKRCLEKPTNYAREKASLLKEKLRAEQSQDQAMKTQIERRLKALDDQAVSIGDMRMSEIKNADKINNSIKHDLTKTYIAVAEANKMYRTAIKVDPFMRRKTQPLMGDTQKCLAAMGLKYKTDIDEAYESKTFIADTTREKLRKEEEDKKRFNLNVAEKALDKAHDFELNIDIDNLIVPDTTMKTATKTTSRPQKSGRLQRIDIAAYKRSKGLI